MQCGALIRNLNHTSGSEPRVSGRSTDRDGGRTEIGVELVQIFNVDLRTERLYLMLTYIVITRASNSKSLVVSCVAWVNVE